MLTLDGREGIRAFWFPRSVSYLARYPPMLTFHAGTSKSALDVLTGVASEYLLNVGRTIQFLSDKYGNKMSPEVGIQYASLSSLVRSY